MGSLLFRVPLKGSRKGSTCVESFGVSVDCQQGFYSMGVSENRGP